MYRLLIVDDETQIREGLKRMLNWNEYGIEVCAEAGNGEQALALIEELEPHIVLTDIKMPVMNGLELLFELKKRDLDTKAVVLSGYEDFSLVRKAMKYGAVDYLLKPAGKADIIQIIEEMLDSFEDGNHLGLNHIDNISLAKYNVLNRMVHYTISPMELTDKLELFKLNFGTGYLAAGIIKVYEDNLDAGVLRDKVQMLFAYCEDAIEKRNKGIVFIDVTGKIAIIFKEINKTEVNLGVEELLKEVVKFALEQLNIHIIISVSGAVESYRYLHKAYGEALDTLQYQFVFEEGNTLFANEIKQYFERKTALVMINSEKIEELLQEGNQDEVEAYISEIFDKFEDKEAFANPYVLKNSALEMVIYAFRFLQSVPMIELDKVNLQKESILKKLSEITSLHKMKEFLIAVILNAKQEYIKSSKLNYSKIVVDAIECVRDYYCDVNLSLQYLADNNHVNVAYLGRIFKKETGNSFNDYLNMYRVEKAKELLMTTNLKGTELCNKVGYSNYNYFYIVFKKITGKKPMEVRTGK